MEWYTTLIAGIAILFVLFLSGAPIFLAFLGSILIGVYFIIGPAGFPMFANSILDTASTTSLASIPLFILIMALANILFSNIVTAAIFGVALNVLYAFVWFRVAISLPSVAVGEHMGSMDAWEITSEHSRDILMMSVVIIVLNSVMSMGVATLFGGLPLVAFILRIIVQWTTMMVGISVLTTLYGHIVEGRSLSGS